MTKKDFETRGVDLGVEIRAEGDDQKTLTGYAAVFNSDTMIGDWFVERIDPGAFDGTLGSDVRALVDHDSGRVIGRTKAGTLRLDVDSRGLKVEIDVPDTVDGRDLWTLVKRGEIDGMSFGFRVTKEEWDESGETPVRTILGLDLFEVSAVAFPAYGDTALAARSLEATRKEAEKIEEQRKQNAVNAARRVAQRKAEMENKIRGIQSSDNDGQEAS